MAPSFWTVVRGRLFNAAAASAIAVFVLQVATKSITEVREVVCRARFVANSERMLVQPAEVFAVTCKVSGTAAKLSEFEVLSRRVIDLTAGQGGVPGTQGSWPIGEGLHDFVSAQFPDSGVSIDSALPPPNLSTLTIVDLVERTVEVVLQPSEGVRSATLDGAGTQTLLVPPDLASGPLSLDIKISPLDRPAGAYKEALLPKLNNRSASKAAEVKGIVPVAVSYSIVSTTRELTLSRVPVQIAGLPETLARYSVTLAPDSQFIADVVVVGPPEAVALLEDNSAKAIAVVHLTHEELVSRATTGIVDFWLLPKGVRVVSVGGSTESQPSVPLEITPISVQAPTAAPAHGAAAESTP
ncbi:MAG: hypothetical protein O2819_01525 [Planctomycetota bacterium]|nr:hypothetical protein [Planctomycetota bacterium]MDA1105029.1 hypothetical protein [Planctomycetota bacterium]